MKTLILDGSHANDAFSRRVVASLEASLNMRAWDAHTVVLREQKIGNCAGDFFCWVKSPGVCNTDDDNRVIAEQIMQSDLVIYLTPVTFGGYSSDLKRIVDHQIQNIAPFFTAIHGETHHQTRYDRYPNILVVGWMDEPEAQTEAIFRHLVERMSINMNSKTTVTGLVTGQPSDSDLTSQTESWLDAIAHASSSAVPALPTQTFSSVVAAPVKRAVLLVGSPRTKKSTSASLGDYLFEQLNLRGVETQTFQIYTMLNSPAKMDELFAALDSADLAVLAFPLYVDTLPAPVISLLERIALHRKTKPANYHFSAIANCGFPEAHHTENALSICAEFARQNGFNWMGSLALGAGEGIVHGTPLKDLDGRAMPIKKALELAAESLSQGKPIPQSARDLLTRPIIPGWMYKLLGGFGWRQTARQYGAQKQLRAKPYQKS
ncbi:MAG: NAD(P)H-dependent oxidoreductase [Anaerolineales bacterium]|nr:NAD(P)H-dependent oxidoreductase [Anaerolineales bacterium]